MCSDGFLGQSAAPEIVQGAHSKLHLRILLSLSDLLCGGICKLDWRACQKNWAEDSEKFLWTERGRKRKREEIHEAKTLEV